MHKFLDSKQLFRTHSFVFLPNPMPFKANLPGNRGWETVPSRK